MRVTLVVEVKLVGTFDTVNSDSDVDLNNLIRTSIFKFRLRQKIAFGKN